MKWTLLNQIQKKHRGKIVTGFAIGTKKLYDFIDDNQQVVFLDRDYVNDTKVICANPQAVALLNRLLK